MSNKGREIKVHFIFVLDLFPSARPPNLCIIYSIPPSESYVCMTAGKGQYQMTPLDNSKIPKLDLQT